MKGGSTCTALLIASIALAPGAGAQKTIENNTFYDKFRSWAIDTQQPDPLPNMFKFCIDNYNKMIAGGVSPDTKVDEGSVRGIKWVGTMKELKEKYCDAGQKQNSSQNEARLGPYRAVLKADKLRMVVNETHAQIMSYALTGGKYTDDPKALAAATVWFLDVGPPSNERQNCVTGGKRATVRRYSFDASQKLVSTTEKEYCGTPPAAAYK